MWQCMRQAAALQPIKTSSSTTIGRPPAYDMQQR
jgi:hypothetical protein